MPSESTPDPAAPEEQLGVAVEHATTRVPLARPEQAVGEVRDGLAGGSFESADAVAVLAASAFVGLVPIERLLAAPADARIADVMDADPPVVASGEDQEVVAWKMVHEGEATLAVVDDAGGFRGIVPPRRMLDVLLSEHDEDLARLGGYLASTKRARQASEESVGRRIWHRLPWLLIGLAGAMASVAIVGAFEEELDRKVLLAFFIPGVVYMADAVGTQTETLLIRGLSVGVTVRGVVGRELLTGVAMGMILGAAFLLFAALAFGDGRVAVAVALALLASCSIATVAAMALPWTFQRLGIDPAFGSGPLATVIQDLLSIAVYFAIAVPIAT
jgi:magnesium transporter